MIDPARRRLKVFGDRVQYVVADLALPLPPEQPVDAVLSTAVFHTGSAITTPCSVTSRTSSVQARNSLRQCTPTLGPRTDIGRHHRSVQLHRHSDDPRRDFRDKLDGFAEQIMKKMLFLEGVLGHDRVSHIIEQVLGEKPTDEEVAEAMGWMRGDFSTKLHPNASLLAMLDGAARLVQMFAEMKWKVATFSELVPITSDSPVSLWVKDPHPFWGVGVATADQISLPVSSSNAFVIYPRADSDSVLEPPSAGDLNRRTMNSPHLWLFMYPGSIERTQHLLEREGHAPGPA